MPDNVAIFWDYENCGLPASERACDAAPDIRQIAHQYGAVKTFKTYMPYPEHADERSMAFRSELQSCGVSLVDYPQSERRDIADNMIVDMMAHAIDNPTPATIILISGSRNFVYAVSILALRKFRIVLIAPSAADYGLKAQANVIYSWPQDVLPDLPPVPSKFLKSAKGSTAEEEVPPDIPSHVDWVSPLPSRTTPHNHFEGQISEPGTERHNEPHSTEEETNDLPPKYPSSTSSATEQKMVREMLSPSVQSSWASLLSQRQHETARGTALSTGSGAQSPWPAPVSIKLVSPDGDCSSPRHSGSSNAPAPAPPKPDGGASEWQTSTRPTAKKSPQVPAEFQPLVKVLKRQLTLGVVMHDLSALGGMLRQEVTAVTSLYERAGVTKLKEYATLAAERGVVTKTSDLGGHIFISLHPTYLGQAA